MYFTDQEPFMNAACYLKTRLSPNELLLSLKNIEQTIGREKSFENGPRLIDLDILLYGSQQVNTTLLKIPHPRMQV